MATGFSYAKTESSYSQRIFHYETEQTINNVVTKQSSHSKKTASQQAPPIQMRPAAAAMLPGCTHGHISETTINITLVNTITLVD